MCHALLCAVLSTCTDLVYGCSLKQTKASQVVQLTYENFDSTVMQSEDTWVVNLSAGPRCGE
jgi:hypothetical protein